MEEKEINKFIKNFDKFSNEEQLKFLNSLGENRFDNTNIIKNFNKFNKNIQDIIISAYINLYADEFWITLSMLWIINLIIHMFVDDLKVNRNKINLITDQLIHIIQIIFTFILYNQ